MCLYFGTFHYIHHGHTHFYDLCPLTKESWECCVRLAFCFCSIYFLLHFYSLIFRKIENLTFILNLITQLTSSYLRADTQHS